MNHDEYFKSVAEGRWPSESLVPIPPPFVDGRGVIQNLVLADFSSAAIITSSRGSVRANHYHKTDWHYSYVVSGCVMYYERPIGATHLPTPKFFNAGTMFFTPPMVEHAMVFPEDTVFLTFAKNIRSHDNHEEDVVRVTVVDPSVVEEIVGK